MVRHPPSWTRNHSSPLCCFKRDGFVTHPTGLETTSSIIHIRSRLDYKLLAQAVHHLPDPRHGVFVVHLTGLETWNHRCCIRPVGTPVIVRYQPGRIGYSHSYRSSRQTDKVHCPPDWIRNPAMPYKPRHAMEGAEPRTQGSKEPHLKGF